MTITREVVIGLDLGTSGVRAVAASPRGRVLATASGGLSAALVRDDGGLHEQDPDVWWRVSCEVIQQVLTELGAGGVPKGAVRGMTVDGTSGTLVCMGSGGVPVRPALMYNDSRSATEAEMLNDLAADFCARLGYRFSASYALAKILWVKQNEPERFRRTTLFQHQADFIAARLVGGPVATDYSNALKTGYDLEAREWPQWIGALEGVAQRLPSVVPPASRLGSVGTIAAQMCGLPAGTPVIAGATDGTAAALASGVRHVGDYNTTLGTTLVFKALSDRLARDPQGLIYSHRLPGGRWLPGAASNTGGEWIGRFFGDADPARLDRAAAERTPVSVLAYPLARQGERFPFLHGGASGILPSEDLPREVRYGACLQGTAFIERLGYEVIDRVAGLSGGEVFTTGGASRSDVWSQIRADITGRVIHRPAFPESAFGSAVLAAAGSLSGGLWDAAAEMVHVTETFVPDPATAAVYDALFRKLIAELRNRGWLQV